MSGESGPLRIAVLGSGHLGSRHAVRLSEAPEFELVAVHDRDPERARAVAAETGAACVESIETVLEDVDAVVVATNTTSHREVAERALEAGCHVLVEKPITGNSSDAEALVRKAEKRDLVLHVGHVERFNPALAELLGKVPAPLFVESHRLAPLVPRNLDINVIQDLMIHDLDLAIAFVGEEPERIDASGVSVLTDRIDIANARLTFPGGAVANLTASRVSVDRVRKFRMFLPGTYISADCAARVGRVFRLKPGHDKLLRDVLTPGGGPLEMLKVLDTDTVGPDGPDALHAEHAAFARAVGGLEHGGVSGREALRTLRAMIAVERAIAEGGGSRA